VAAIQAGTARHAALSQDRYDGHMCLTGEERRPMVSPSGELEVDIPD
jgi:hypothetical protein